MLRLVEETELVVETGLPANHPFRFLLNLNLRLAAPRLSGELDRPAPRRWPYAE